MIDIMFFLVSIVILSSLREEQVMHLNHLKKMNRPKNMQAEGFGGNKFCCHVRGISFSSDMTMLSCQGNKFMMLSCEGNNHLASYDNVVMSGE